MLRYGSGLGSVGMCLFSENEKRREGGKNKKIKEGGKGTNEKKKCNGNMLKPFLVLMYKG